MADWTRFERMLSTLDRLQGVVDFAIAHDGESIAAAVSPAHRAPESNFETPRTSAPRLAKPRSHTKALGLNCVPTELVAYPREGHGYQEREHALESYRRTVDWFERFVEAEG